MHTAPNTVSPETHSSHDAKYFRAIVAANNQVNAAQEALIEAVSAAREARESWLVIGTALGISKQEAQQRFSTVVKTIS